MLIVGAEPSLVDLSDPALPPGMTAEKVRAGLDRAVEKLRAQGRDAELVLTKPGKAAGDEVAAALQRKFYDCVVVGAGLRTVVGMTETFEAIMNAIHNNAPQARLAFNVGPEDSVAAAERQLGNS